MLTNRSLTAKDGHESKWNYIHHSHWQHWSQISNKEDFPSFFFSILTWTAMWLDCMIKHNALPTLEYWNSYSAKFWLRKLRKQDKTRQECEARIKSIRWHEGVRFSRPLGPVSEMFDGCGQKLVSCYKPQFKNHLLTPYPFVL